MNAKELTKELCKLEGKKKQVNIAQMSEIVGKTADILYRGYMCDEEHTYQALLRLGYRRHLKKKARRK